MLAARARPFQKRSALNFTCYVPLAAPPALLHDAFSLMLHEENGRVAASGLHDRFHYFLRILHFAFGA